VFAVLVRAPASGTSWDVPTFEEMFSEATFVGIVEVVQGGKAEVKARAVETLAGKVPGEAFWISGFDTEFGQAPVAGDRVLVFLFLYEPPPRRGGNKGGGQEPTCRIPTPYSGDYRIKKGRIHGGWYTVETLGGPQPPPGVEEAL